MDVQYASRRYERFNPTRSYAARGGGGSGCSAEYASDDSILHSRARDVPPSRGSRPLERRFEIIYREACARALRNERARATAGRSLRWWCVARAGSRAIRGRTFYRATIANDGVASARDHLSSGRPIVGTLGCATFHFHSPEGPLLRSIRHAYVSRRAPRRVRSRRRGDSRERGRAEGER